MLSIEVCALPQNALLQKYLRPGVYTDCYCTEVDLGVTHAQYVNAFYTTWLFKLERIILKLAVSRPSTDAQARQLADGTIDTFAAWRVEERCENQLLLTDIVGRTRSWLMLAPSAGEVRDRTVLYFGSAVTPKVDTGSENSTLGPVFSSLIGFHKLYSVLLLRAARSRLQRTSS